MGVGTLLRKLTRPQTRPKQVKPVEPEATNVRKAKPHRKKKAHQRKTDSDECVVENDTQVDNLDDDGPAEQYQFESSETLSTSEPDSDDDDAPNYIGDFPLFMTEESGKEFAVLSPTQIVKEQEEAITSLADLLSIDKATAGNLLRYFSWNREKLLAQYFENPQSVCEAAGVGAAPEDEVSSKAVQLEGEAECTVCGELTTPEDSTALSCMHRFCNSCWRDFLTMNIQEGQSTTLHCMHYQCNVRVDESIVKHIVEPEIFDKYARFVITSFVEDNDNVKWCPTPNCGNAVAAELITGITEVRCVCGYRFCFRCHRDAHAPATCEQMRLWEEKCKDDSETLNWVQANAKVCPKCQVPTEKNGGCNHMTCRQCKHEWCWVCLSNWKGHNDYYNCTRYEKKQRKLNKKSSKFTMRRAKAKRQQREEDREQYRAALDRYLHFYLKYQSHTNSLQLEQSTRETALKKMIQLEKQHLTRVQVQFIEEATECLLHCRAVLKYSYVFAYYLNEGPTRHLFEYLQENLATTTEQLSRILDNEVPDRLETVNVTQLAETRRLNLVTFVEQELFQSDDLWSDKPTSLEAFDLVN